MCQNVYLWSKELKVLQTQGCVVEGQVEMEISRVRYSIVSIMYSGNSLFHAYFLNSL